MQEQEEGQGLSRRKQKHNQKGNTVSCVSGKRRESNVMRTTGFGGGGTGLLVSFKRVIII